MPGEQVESISIPKYMFDHTLCLANRTWTESAKDNRTISLRVERTRSTVA
jgi:hypothetical protein